MHVMESGPEDGPTVLLLHGNPTWGFLWRKVVLALGGAPIRIVMPDLVGLGLSDKPPAETHTLDFHATQLEGLVRALNLKEVVFAGQDWGGPIGIAGLLQAQDAVQVKGLVVLNTVLGPPKPGFRPTAFHRFARLPVIADAVFRLGQFPQSMLGRAQGDRHSISGDVARGYTWPLRERADRIAPLALARMVPNSLEHPSAGPLRRIEGFAQAFKGPAAIVWGERDPVLGRLRRRIENLLPHARVTSTNAGHFLQEEVPNDIADALRYVVKAA
ncbi:MAG: alpha/beta fold hydrolase [Myxococcaceae bacterium]|nr:alpha/beta fold hydrolase [Myxococcaceae bacterium]